MTALEIINNWCEVAHSQRKWDHKACFWVIRDILQGGKVSDRLRSDAIAWFILKVKESPEKKKIKEAIGI